MMPMNSRTLLRYSDDVPWFLRFVFVFAFLTVTSVCFATDPSDVHRDRGNAYYQKKQYAQAVDEFTQAIDINHDSIEAYFNRGVAYYELHLYYKAIVDFDMVLMLDPNVREAYYRRGLAYSRVNKLKLALADIKKAAELGDPSAKTALENGDLTDQIEKEKLRQANIQSVIQDKRNEYNRTVTVTTINNEFGGNTVLTVHAKGDPLFDGKEGVFKSIDYFNAGDVLVKTEIFHTYMFNSVNGRNKTVLWYNPDSTLNKKEYFYTGKKLTLKEELLFDKQGVLLKKVLFDRFGKEVRP